MNSIHWSDLQSETLTPEEYFEKYNRKPSIVKNYEEYQPKIEVIQEIRKILKEKNESLKILIIGADWCPDCSVNTPRMVQIRDKINDVTSELKILYGVKVNALRKQIVSRIILARPAVEAGESLGYLPGDLNQKVSPYLRPLYDALYDMVEVNKIQDYIDRGIIEVVPLAYMRGRTLNDSFVILDEAQNSTPEQMKMFLTRLGFDSKTVITGDITQSDLPEGKPVGLLQAQEILKDIEGIKFVYFGGQDVVRHALVQRVIEAYDKANRNK